MKHNFYFTIGLLHVLALFKDHHQTINTIRRNTSVCVVMFSFICELTNLHFDIQPLYKTINIYTSYLTTGFIKGLNIGM
jgi:hypothetical protein